MSEEMNFAERMKQCMIEQCDHIVNNSSAFKNLISALNIAVARIELLEGKYNVLCEEIHRMERQIKVLQNEK